MKIKQTQWVKLDKAARIFPCISSKRDPNVFRFACELMDPVEPDFLQKAVDQTLEEFPLWGSVLKRGLFWYFLESSSLKPKVQPETKVPCAPIYDRDVRKLLFEVTYYQNRINLEVYHVLTDGTGALQFFRSLVTCYLYLRYQDIEEIPNLGYDASRFEQAADSFQKYYGKQCSQKPPKAPKAYQLRGGKNPDNRFSVIEGTVPLDQMLFCCKEKKVSLTVMLASILMNAIGMEMSHKDKERPVVLSVPINLRHYFPSESARNFFSLMNVRYDFSSENGNVEEILGPLKEQFKKGLSEDEMIYRVNQFMTILQNPITRITILPVKDFFMRLGYQVVSKTETADISNLGPIDLPEKAASHVKMFDVFASKDGLQLCLCSFKNVLTMTFTSSLRNTNIQKNFFRTLAGMGLPVTIAAVPFSQEEL